MTTMTAEEYRQLSKRTVKPGMDGDFAFWALGIAGEGGEFADMMKKAIYHGHEITSRDLKNELGDLLFYVAGALRLMNITFEEVMEYNILKLRTRYPDGFSSEASKARVDVNAVNENRPPDHTGGATSE